MHQTISPIQYNSYLPKKIQYNSYIDNIRVTNIVHIFWESLSWFGVLEQESNVAKRNYYNLEGNCHKIMNT